MNPEAQYAVILPQSLIHYLDQKLNEVQIYGQDAMAHASVQHAVRNPQAVTMNERIAEGAEINPGQTPLPQPPPKGKTLKQV